MTTHLKQVAIGIEVEDKPENDTPLIPQLLRQFQISTRTYVIMEKSKSFRGTSRRSEEVFCGKILEVKIS